MTKPVYGGNAWAMYTTDCNPQIATIRAKTMEAQEPDDNRSGDILCLDVKVDNDKIRVKLLEKVPEQSEGIRLEDAKVVIGGGRGVGSPESFDKLNGIATLLNGAVGASRAACDNGWIPGTKQIGLTGRVVTPEVYLAVGISGASQHMAGCHGASHIIAINNDDGAHIFNEANYGVNGDWELVMDGFVKKLKELGPA
jgi:electron transfer flavoprotein alpha subunit